MTNRQAGLQEVITDHNGAAEPTATSAFPWPRGAQLQVSIDGALKSAALVGAPFITVENSVYLVEQMRAAYTHEHDAELPDAVEKLLRGAEKHDGPVMALAVSWVPQGLVYEWVAQSDWIDPLLTRIPTELENAQAESGR